MTLFRTVTCTKVVQLQIKKRNKRSLFKLWFAFICKKNSFEWFMMHFWIQPLFFYNKYSIEILQKYLPYLRSRGNDWQIIISTKEHNEVKA